jgi:hypothetical protein
VRLFVPSYQIPGTWLENLRYLAPLQWIGGVELLIFSFDPESRDLFVSEIEEIKDYAKRFAFTLHLPDPLPSTEGNQPSPILEELFALTDPIVERYVVHPPQSTDFDSWATTLTWARRNFGTERFLLEYTGKEAFAAAEIATAPSLSDLPICADTGCLLKEGLDPAAWVSAYTSRIKEIHLHGIGTDPISQHEAWAPSPRERKDHRPLEASDTWALYIAALAEENEWIVNLETFSIAETEKSGTMLSLPRGARAK